MANKAQGYNCPVDGYCVTCVGEGDVLTGICPMCKRSYSITVESLNPSPVAHRYGAPLTVHDPSYGVASAPRVAGDVSSGYQPLTFGGGETPGTDVKPTSTSFPAAFPETFAEPKLLAK